MIQETIGNILIIMGLLFIILGAIGIHRFKHFYSRVLIGSTIDTVGFLLFMFGIIIKQGVSWFSAKVLLIIIIMVLINPVVTHKIVRSAYQGGYRIDSDKGEKSND